MKDMQAQLEKLRVQVSECELIRDLATDKFKRELFAGLAEHYKALVSEVERAIVSAKSGSARSG
ncbi:hypothetical protein [Bradyrhizobium sp.]|uniref:hypothetical protein n=1 Tax=Bradyrhizobium sp. TaxID=376 RepID=UPI0023876398|nr:hypothetical protein [Bradyrhizobium sp.]MDE2378714.1 hypothetical protein [Bradyrhizobium sp.]